MHLILRQNAEQVVRVNRILDEDLLLLFTTGQNIFYCHVTNGSDV